MLAVSFALAPAPALHARCMLHAAADGDGDGCFRSMRWRKGVAGGAFGLRLLQPLAAGKVNERDLRSILWLPGPRHDSMQHATRNVQQAACNR